MTKDWLSIQSEACHLHANRYTLDEIKAALYERHKFQASTRAWRTKFKEWGIKHRTANTSRICKTVKSHSRKVQVPEKRVTAKTPASISLDSPVLRHFRDGRVNEDTKYLDDLDEDEKWISLAKEFVAHEYDDDTTSSYYEHLCREIHDHCRESNLVEIRQAIDQVRKKAFWDIMRNRAKVLRALYSFYPCADCFQGDIDNYLFESCVERNEFCAHSTECRSVASAMLLHTKEQDVTEYWEVLGWFDRSLNLILRAWMSGDLRDPEICFERYINNYEEFATIDTAKMILKGIRDDHPEIRVKAMEIVAARYEEDPFYMSDLTMCLREPYTTQSPLNWRLAEIMLRYSSADPVYCLERLTYELNMRHKDKDEGRIDFKEPSLSAMNALRARLEGSMKHVSLWKDSSKAEKHQVLSYWMHIITKAWLDLVLDDETGSLALNASDILNFREDFGGLPKLRLSVGAAALAQMSSSPDLQSLRPALLETEYIPEIEPRKDTSNENEQESEDESAPEDEDEQESVDESTSDYV